MLIKLDVRKILNGRLRMLTRVLLLSEITQRLPCSFMLNWHIKMLFFSTNVPIFIDPSGWVKVISLGWMAT